MARTQVGRDVLLQLGEDLLLDRRAPRTRPRRPGRSRRSRRGRSCPDSSARSRLAPSGESRRLPSRVSISPRIRARPRSTRPASRSEMTTGTCSRRRNSSASWLAIRPAPTTPTLVDRPGQRRVRGTGGLARPLLHEVEGVEAGAQLRAHEQVGQGLVLGREGGRRARPSGPRRSARAPGRAPGAAPATLASATARPRATAASQASPRSTSGRSTATVPASTRPAQSSERSRKSAPSNSTSAMPSSAACAPGEHPVLVQRVLDDHLDGALGADEVRQQVGPAPAGNMPRKHSGSADAGRGGRDGAEVAVQGQLQPAAEGQAVDEGEGRHAARGAAGRRPRARSGRWPGPARAR